MNNKKSSPYIINLDTIKTHLPNIDVFDAIIKGFIAYSKGEAVIPPVGELLFDNPPGDVHIKYGYIRSQPYYVVKIASGFYENPQLGLSPSQGLNLLFDKNNGLLCAVLLDEGHLTDLRTAVAGALASKELAAQSARTIGIVGAGIQGHMQLEYHQKILDLEKAYCWNRDSEKAKQLADKMQSADCPIIPTNDLEELCHHSQIIVTTTAATNFLIKNEWVQPGTHLTAMGSDTSEKIELDPALLGRADLVVVDSISQSLTRGEIFQAAQADFLDRTSCVELGRVLNNDHPGRQNEQQITIADLTGVAVQDLMISQAVFEAFSNSNS